MSSRETWREERGGSARRPDLGRGGRDGRNREKDRGSSRDTSRDRGDYVRERDRDARDRDRSSGKAREKSKGAPYEKRGYSPIIWDLNGASNAKKPVIAASMKARLGPTTSSPVSKSPQPSSPANHREQPPTPVEKSISTTPPKLTPSKPPPPKPSPQPLASSPRSEGDDFSRSPSSPQSRTPTPGDVEELEPGQLPAESPQGEGEGAIAGVAKSRWAEAQTPEHEAEPPPAKKARSGGTSQERGMVRAASEQDMQRARSKSVEEGQGGKGEGVRSGDSYERELNRKELEELADEGEDEGEDVGIPDGDDSDEPEESPKGPPAAGRSLINMLKGCRSVDEFERLNRIDEGTYGVVYRARDKKTGEVVALKKVKMEKEREGFPLTSLREINILLSLHHPSVVDVKEVVVGNNLDSIFMVMEYMEHDLKSLMESMKQPFNQSEVKCLMLQLLSGTSYLHSNWVLHRDLKTSNLLLNNRGELKICDFGLARQYGSPLKAYTHMVVTLWYRAPELLLGKRLYSTAIDMWSLGCIMAELLAKEPLFNGKTEIDQVDKIFKLLGTPSDKIWPEFSSLPGVKNVKFVRQPYNRLREKYPAVAMLAGRPVLSDAGFDLLNKLLTYDPAKRLTADEALQHPWFREVPLPKDKELMPTFPTRSDHDRRKRMLRSPDPLEEQRQREKRQPAGGGGLFGL